LFRVGESSSSAVLVAAQPAATTAAFAVFLATFFIFDFVIAPDRFFALERPFDFALRDFALAPARFDDDLSLRVEARFI
jgi:hypothetical protein